jgi:hypothetical protein
MKSIYRFLIKPKKERYNNTIELNGQELIINTKIETFESVSKNAIVEIVPEAFKTKIKPGDEVIVHHNVFRRFYDMKGKEKNSASFFKDDLFFCDIEQIYLYKSNDSWKTNLNYCFVKPLKNDNKMTLEKEKPLKGIIKYSNDKLSSNGVKSGDLITFTPNSEFEFIIEGERLYCMKSNDIAIRHERKGNEEEYNPSWAHCG